MTLVIYMGVATCSVMQRALIAAGLSGATPVAVIQDATLARERQIRTTLEHLARDIAMHAIESPAIMVIGEVAREQCDNVSSPWMHASPRPDYDAARAARLSPP